MSDMRLGVTALAKEAPSEGAGSTTSPTSMPILIADDVEDDGSCAPLDVDAQIEETRCEMCGRVVRVAEQADHLAAHRLHSEVIDEDMTESLEPENLAFRVIQVVRQAGKDLPGNITRRGLQAVATQLPVLKGLDVSLSERTAWVQRLG
jgi:hypothetical protein